MSTIITKTSAAVADSSNVLLAQLILQNDDLLVELKKIKTGIKEMSDKDIDKEFE